MALLGKPLYCVLPVSPFTLALFAIEHRHISTLVGHAPAVAHLGTIQ